MREIHPLQQGPPPSVQPTNAPARPRSRSSSFPRAQLAFASPPPLGGELVRRPRLVERLIGASDPLLALIVAPPGYGKSTLLGEWQSAAPATVRVAAARRLGLGPDSGSGHTGARRCQVAAPAVRARGRRCRPGRAVAAARRAHAVARGAARRSAAGARIATEPALPIGRLRAHRRLVELRMADLATTPTEAAILLARRASSSSPRPSRSWSTGPRGGRPLYLAALSSDGSPIPPRASGSAAPIICWVKSCATRCARRCRPSWRGS